MSVVPAEESTTSRRPATVGFSLDRFDLRLQSVRGLAALVVALHHCLRVFPAGATGAVFLRRMDDVLNAHAAVLMFFVLSGYVLGLSLRKSPRPGLSVYFAFMVRRVCRIMLPLVAVVVGLSLVVFGILWCVTGRTYVPVDFWPGPGFGSAAYHIPLDGRMVVANVLLYKFALNPPTWTIAVEMIGSVFVPLWFWLNREALWRWATILVLVIVALVDFRSNTSAWHYLYVFDLGLLIPYWGPPILALLNHRYVFAGAVVTAGVIYVGANVAADQSDPAIAYNSDFFSSGALTFLLAVVIFRDHVALRLLDWPLVEWLGKISFSFYLAHWPVFWLIGWSLNLGAPAFCREDPLAGSFLVALGAIPCTALLSGLLYQRVELPAIALGKRLSGRIR